MPPRPSFSASSEHNYAEGRRARSARMSRVRSGALAPPTRPAANAMQTHPASQHRIRGHDGGVPVPETAGQVDCTPPARTPRDGLSRTYKAEAGGSSPSAPTVYSLFSSSFRAVCRRSAASESLCGPLSDRSACRTTDEGLSSASREAEIAGPSSHRPLNLQVRRLSSRRRMREPARSPWPIRRNASAA